MPKDSLEKLANLVQKEEFLAKILLSKNMALIVTKYSEFKQPKYDVVFHDKINANFLLTPLPRIQGINEFIEIRKKTVGKIDPPAYFNTSLLTANHLDAIVLGDFSKINIDDWGAMVLNDIINFDELYENEENTRRNYVLSGFSRMLDYLTKTIQDRREAYWNAVNEKELIDVFDGASWKDEAVRTKLENNPTEEAAIVEEYESLHALRISLGIVYEKASYVAEKLRSDAEFIKCLLKDIKISEKLEKSAETYSKVASLSWQMISKAENMAKEILETSKCYKETSIESLKQTDVNYSTANAFLKNLS